jgi:hypothetical protein
VSGSGGRPAFYALAGTGPLRDWVTLLHPPYTAWHLSYVVIGGTLRAPVEWGALGLTVLAFFLGVGVAAHALDELNGRPLRTAVPAPALVAAAAASLLLAVVAGLAAAGPTILPWAAVGVLLVVGYNLELFGGVLHNTFGFAAAWGAFPVLVSAWVQTGTLGPDAVLAAVAAFAFSWAQRALSTPARELRRRVRSATLRIEYADGRAAEHGVDALLAPLEHALRASTWAVVALAAALAAARLFSG